jgi:hypothetical protein
MFCMLLRILEYAMDKEESFDAKIYKNKKEGGFAFKGT